MEVRIKFRDDDARSVHYFLQHYYRSNTGLPKLAKQAVRDIVAIQAKVELDESRARYDAENTSESENL